MSSVWSARRDFSQAAAMNSRSERMEGKAPAVFCEEPNLVARKIWDLREAEEVGLGEREN
jgi:hypothetical protein